MSQGKKNNVQTELDNLRKLIDSGEGIEIINRNQTFVESVNEFVEQNIIVPEDVLSKPFNI